MRVVRAGVSVRSESTWDARRSCGRERSIEHMRGSRWRRCPSRWRRCPPSRSDRRVSWPAPCGPGKVSAVELLRAYLDRVDRLNPKINAIVVDDRERALKDARAADRLLAKGGKVGPPARRADDGQGELQHPRPPTTFGFPAFAANIASAGRRRRRARLRAAGAVIFGKTNVPIALSDFQSYNDVYGTTNNPWDVSRGPPAARRAVRPSALAAGLTGLEFGSDIGGSIRNPAAYNGVYGHKPTYGIVPKRGHTRSAALRRRGGDLGGRAVGPLGRRPRPGPRRSPPAPTSRTATGSSCRRRPSIVQGLRVAVWLDEPDAHPSTTRDRRSTRPPERCSGPAPWSTSVPARDFDVGGQRGLPAAPPRRR